MLIREAPEYAYRLSDLPPALQVGDDATKRGLKALYNANISTRSVAEAVARALQWGRKRGLVP